MTTDPQSYVSYQCSNCGSDDITVGSIQFGLGGKPIGFCGNCSAPKRPQLPSDDDHSEKGEKRRKDIIKAHSTKTYRTVLRPLVPLGEFRKRTKPVEAEPLVMWDDTAM